MLTGSVPNSPNVAILDQTGVMFNPSDSKPMIMSSDVNFMPKLNQTVKIAAKRMDFPVKPKEHKVAELQNFANKKLTLPSLGFVNVQTTSHES